MIDGATFAKAIAAKLRTMAGDIEATRALEFHVAYGDERTKCRETIAMREAADVVEDLLTTGEFAALMLPEVVAGENPPAVRNNLSL